MHKRIQPPANFLSGTLGTQIAQPLVLAAGNAFVYLENVKRLLLARIRVYAHDDLFLAVHGHLIAVGRFGDFALWIRPFDGRHQSAERVYLFDVIPGAAFDLIGE